MYKEGLARLCTVTLWFCKGSREGQSISGEAALPFVHSVLRECSHRWTEVLQTAVRSCSSGRGEEIGCEEVTLVECWWRRNTRDFAPSGPEIRLDTSRRLLYRGLGLTLLPPIRHHTTLSANSHGTIQVFRQKKPSRLTFTLANHNPNTLASLRKNQICRTTAQSRGCSTQS